MPKVLRVVRTQLERGLGGGGCSSGALAEELARIPYAEVKRVWDAERAAMEAGESAKAPIRELRDALRPDILALVKANRLRALKAGACFPKYATGTDRPAREKGKWIWCYLPPPGPPARSHNVHLQVVSGYGGEQSSIPVPHHELLLLIS